MARGQRTSGRAVRANPADARNEFFYESVRNRMRMVIDEAVERDDQLVSAVWDVFIEQCRVGKG